MHRTAQVATLVLLVAVAVVRAEEGADQQQIRDLLNLETRSHIAGDVDRLMSCYTPDVVGYLAGGEAPQLWTVMAVGRDSLRATYGAQAREGAKRLAAHPEVQLGREVLHIDIKQDRALALVQYWMEVPDSSRGETVFTTHQSVWQLTKASGEWKINGFIAAVTFEQKIYRTNY